MEKGLSLAIPAVSDSSFARPLGGAFPTLGSKWWPGAVVA